MLTWFTFTGAADFVWQAKFEIIQLKLRSRSRERRLTPMGPPAAEIGIKMSWILLLASHTIMLLDNFNQEIRKFKKILQLYLNLTRQIEEKKKTFYGLTFVMRIKSWSFLVLVRQTLDI